MSNWESIKLIDLCNVEYGTRVVRKRDGGTIFPVYGGGGATFSMDVYNRENRMVIARFAISEKCTRFVKGKFFLNDSGLTISTKDKNLIDENFLNYQMLSLNDKIYSLARGTAQKNLNVDEFKKLMLSFPDSIEEQKEIVVILDQVFESIDKAKANIEKNIENAKELFQSKLNQIFSQTGDDWTQVVIESICNKTKNINWKENIESQFDYIDLSSVSRTSLSITETKKIDFKNAPSRAKKIVKENDIIFGTTRPTLKRATKITEKYNNQVCSTGFVVLSPKDPKDSEWIFYFLLSNKFMKRMESLQRGASYPAVSDNDVKKSILSIPSKKSIKTEIIKNLDALDNHIQSLLLSYNEELNNLEELKKSILQKAFSGELTNKNKAA